MNRTTELCTAFILFVVAYVLLTGAVNAPAGQSRDLALCLSGFLQAPGAFFAIGRDLSLRWLGYRS